MKSGIDVEKVDFQAIEPLRTLFLQEANFQIRYNAVHERGWSDSYVLKIDKRIVGYGSVMRQERQDRDTIFEFYVLPAYRKWACFLFARLITASKAIYIECQSNDRFLTSMVYEFADRIRSEVILFKDFTATAYESEPGIVFRLSQPDDIFFEHTSEPEGAYVLELNGEIVATGGFLLHYNRPFADLYMEVKKEYRQRGLGSFLLQELKKECYLAGRVPAARCNIENKASRFTLLKAGFSIAGFMLVGKVRKVR